MSGVDPKYVPVPDYNFKVLVLGLSAISTCFISVAYYRTWSAEQAESIKLESNAGETLSSTGAGRPSQIADMEGRGPRVVTEVPDIATHASRLIYFATDRSRVLPFGGVTMQTFLLLSLCQAALVIIVLRSSANKYLTGPPVIALCLYSIYLAAPGYFPFRTNSIQRVFDAGRDDLRYGTCLVAIPINHREGSIEGPSLLTFKIRQDPERHVVLEHIDPMNQGTFTKDLAQTAANCSWPEALVFIHGYNTSFEEAARRAAQLSHDLRFGGVTAFFSWPSAGTYLDYTRDGQNALYAAPHLSEFLELLATRCNLKRIHVVCHSMGNQCLAVATQKKLDTGTCKFDECVLAAPDVDAAIFEMQYAQSLIQQAGRLTLYAAKNDSALQISQVPNGYVRLGDSSSMKVLDGMESIDVTATGLGHSSFGDSPLLIEDLRQMIDDDLPAHRRKNLIERKAKASLSYWVLTR